MTELEIEVLETAKKHCESEYSSSVLDIAKETGLEVKTVRGVVGSLVKKDLLYAEEDDRVDSKFFDLFVVVDGGLLSFGEVS